MTNNVPSSIIGDENRTRQILFNICGNAIKFTERGGVSLFIDYDSRAGSLTLDISETGIGMSLDEMDHIFDEYAQANSKTTRLFGGTGLGLSISKKLIEGMGGSICRRKPGGARFKILHYPSSVKDHDVELLGETTSGQKSTNLQRLQGPSASILRPLRLGSIGQNTFKFPGGAGCAV